MSPSRPLPKDLDLAAEQLSSPNLSLLYYKLTPNTKGDSSAKERFLKAVIETAKRCKGDYLTAFNNRKKFLGECVGSSFTLQTCSRLVFGMGYESTLETGLSFDWTTGLPIIPGSSLKGSALTAARYALMGELEIFDDAHKIVEVNDEDVQEIFGPEPLAPNNQAGKIIFFPAYPDVDNVAGFLEMDVMTPHYSEYYSNPGEPPADWYSPVPIHFLVVPAGITYNLRIANRDNLSDTHSPIILKTQAILKTALKEFGAGAKTSVGYGYFKS